MNIRPIETASVLKLVHPPEAAKPQATPAPAATQSRRCDDCDSFDLSSVRHSQLPRMPLTEAHHRLDRIRSLVAARTDVPIHFDGQPVSLPSANPYASPYGQMRLPSNVAEFNAVVTETQAADSNSTERVG